MDDETRAYLDAMVVRINNQFERVLDGMTALRADFQNAKGFLPEDGIVMGRRMTSLEDRVSRLEKGKEG